MTQIFSQIRTRQFGILTLVVIALGIIGGVVIAKTRRAKLVQQTLESSPPVVVSLTSSIRVVEANSTIIGSSPVLNITLQNISSKQIKAYVISRGKGFYTKSYLFVETVFASNTTETSMVPWNDPPTNGIKKDWAVTGVLFEDGSVEGQASSTLKLIQTYRGAKDQAKRLSSCLQQLSHATSLQQKAALARCKTDVANLPVNEGSPDYQEGLRNAQLMFSTHLTEIQDMLAANRSEDALLKQQSVIRVFQHLGQAAQLR